MPTVTYTGINHQVNCDDPDITLLECSIINKIPHLHECGGNGRCTTCRVRVMDGHKNLTPRTFIEQEAARSRRWDPSIRLACQSYIKGDISIQRLVWTSSEVNKLQLETIPEGEAEERAIAILFCDMRGFTQIASGHFAFDTAHMLNRFYTVLGEPILMNNGIIYQYVGDEIIGIFGVSGGTRDKNCKDAIRAALGMQYAIKRLNHFELVDFETDVQVGIGINFGKAFLGHLGHPNHKQFAVIGDPVNTASRIQAFTKKVNSNTLISNSVLRSLPENTVEVGETYSEKLRGHEHETVFHELIGFTQLDIQLELQSSLEYLLQNEDEFADKFYKRVFAKSPETRNLFKNNLKQQGRLLTHMLGGIIYTMSRPDHMHLGLKELGRNHHRYGVKPEHYPVVLASLLETIEEQLGEFYNENLATAWLEALTLVTNEMKKYMLAMEEPVTPKSI
ncbi:MAG: 2Fe-2S iron-sulfur cluster binding domain-containing protein [Bacteroidales bacterium]|nr:2Fe-2S iron-sulfur cluster binding domain-containing protein [Bacteroidales bacterium]